MAFSAQTAMRFAANANTNANTNGRNNSTELRTNSLTARDAFRSKNTRHRGYTLSGQINVEVIVAGARVRVQEEGFNRKKFFDVESLRHEYYPLYDDDTATDPNEHAKMVLAARILFSRIFPKQMSEYDEESVPCVTGNDRYLLLEGLNNRYDRLLVNVVNYNKESHGRMTVRLRQLVEHLERLKTMIDAIQANDGCDQPGYGERDGLYKIHLTSEEIDVLLRQFSFLVLQATHPNQNYTQFESSMSPQEFIELLQENPIDRSSMDQYIESYHGIPPVLATILDDTNVQSDVYETMMDQDMDELFMRNVEIFKNAYPGDSKWSNDLSTELERINANGYTDPRKKIRDLIQFLVNTWKLANENVNTYKDQVKTVKKQAETVELALHDLKTSKDGYEAELSTMRDTLANLLNRAGGTTIPLSSIVSANELKKAIEKVGTYVDGLKSDIAKKTEDQEGLKLIIQQMTDQADKEQQVVDSSQVVLNTSAQTMKPAAKPKAKATAKKVVTTTPAAETKQQGGADETLTRIRELASGLYAPQQTGGGEETPANVPPAFMTLLKRVRNATDLHTEDQAVLKVSSKLCEFSQLLTLVRGPIAPVFNELINITKRIQPIEEEKAAFAYMNSLLQILLPEATTIQSTTVLRSIEEKIEAQERDTLTEKLQPLVTSVAPHLVTPADTTLSTPLLFGLLLAAIQRYLLTIGANTLNEYHCPIPPELLETTTPAA